MVVKTFVSYLLVLFIPFTVVSIYFYNQNITNLINQKDDMIKMIISQNREIINSKIASVEDLSDRIVSGPIIKKFFYNTDKNISELVHEENTVFNGIISILADDINRNKTINTAALNDIFQRTLTSSESIVKKRNADQSSDAAFLTTDFNRVVYNIKFYAYSREIPKGQYINSVYDVIDADWYKKIQDLPANIGTWEGAHLCRTDMSMRSTEVLTYYRNLYNANFQSPIATLQIDVDRNSFFHDIENIIIEKSGFLFVVTDSGKVLATGRHDVKNTDGVEENIGEVVALLKQGYIYEEHKSKYIVFHVPLEKLNLDDENINLVASIPINEYYGRVNAQRIVFSVIIIIALLALVVIAYLLTLLNSTRVRKVLIGIRKISKGDMKARIEINGRDEIGEIAEDLNFMAEKLDNMINVAYKATIAEKEAMLSALQSQINPHFLYNTLESIKMMAEIRQELEISDVLDSLGKFMRYNISRPREFVTLKEEINNVLNYFYIQKIRFKDLIGLSVNISDDLIEYKVPKMILQPLVENAIIHGPSGNFKRVQIEICAVKTGDILNVVVRNYGKTIPLEQIDLLEKHISGNEGQEVFNTTGNGIGLRNINERVKLYYGEVYGLKIANFSEEDRAGVEVTVFFPVEVMTNGLQAASGR